MAANPELPLPPAAHVVDPLDDVAVCLRDLDAGATLRIGGREIVVCDAIAAGHKVALRDIGAGEAIRKFGWPIGRARGAIAQGSWVHSHNLVTQLAGVEEFDFGADGGQAATALQSVAGTPFLGYRRKDGRVGTRNEIWILTTVGCVNRTAERIARAAHERYAGRVDGVHAFTHPFGCSQLGDDLGRTRHLIGALANHPNAGGVLILGLGCESNQLAALLADAPGLDRERLRAFTAQSAEDEIEEGLRAVEELVAIAERDQRTPCPLATLKLGLKCGGSDGFSGISANPLVGRIADRVAAAGGTPILTEIPEVFGAERLLLGRAVSRKVFDDMVAVVGDFRRYYLDHGLPIHENPSPGNIAGGITTLEEKSLGAVQKGGRAPLAQVLRYADQAAAAPGLALLEAPGNDAVSSTALVAAGATVLLFTTGRGTPLGFPAPTLKISSNSALAAKKPRWIDFDAGRVLGGTSLGAASDELMDLVLRTASGQPTRSEVNDEREIAIWKGGVTL
ncbi:MAG TPA: altronate dehydratase family protein [Steroidobacteraceae bacterium]|nr:altronate dehydratase family protein [Steroidobacteraceae bacterium]